MIPTIGLMVAVVGIVVCVYVLAQSVRTSQLEGTSAGVRIVLLLAALVALGGVVGLMSLANDLVTSSTQHAASHPRDDSPVNSQPTPPNAE